MSQTTTTTYTVKVDGLEVEQTFTRGTLETQATTELRTLYRRLLGGKAWVGSATKQTLVDAILDRTTENPDRQEIQVPVPVPVKDDGTPVLDGDKSAALEALKTLLGNDTKVDADQVRKIITDVLNDDKQLQKKVAEAVKTAVGKLPPVEVKIGNQAPKKLDGPQHAMFARAIKHGGRGTRTWIAGPAGSGKTMGAIKAAEALDLKVFLITPCYTRYDVLGHYDAQSNVVNTEVTRWARFQGDKCLILDEVDGWSEGAQLAANALLANDHVILPDGPCSVNPENKFRVWIVATANTWGTGPNSKYVGRRKMDAAFLNRWSAKIFWGYDNAFERRIVDSYIPKDTPIALRSRVEALVEGIQAARRHVDSKGIEITISPRQSIDGAKSILDGDSDKVVWDEIILGGGTEQQRSDIRKAVKGGC